MKKVIYFLFLFLIIPSIVSAASLEEQRTALIETANAYHRQGIQVQYDSYKKSMYQTPEDATRQHYNYTVCSGFTFETYYYTLGIEIPETTNMLLNYAEKNKDNTKLIPIFKGTANDIYTDTFLGSDTSNAENLLKEWMDLLQPGDIFVVTGHAMLIEKIDKQNNKIVVLESTYLKGEGRYNYDDHYDKFESTGSIKRSDLLSLLNYYYKNKVDRIAIIRIINEEQTFIDAEGKTIKYEITDSAKTRMDYSKIDIEKTVDIESSKKDQSLFANLNDKMTYTITITNNSDSKYENLKVIENIDSKLIIDDKGSGIEKDNTLTWDIPTINPKETYTIKFTVHVKNDKNNLGKIILSAGKVNNIATSKIETLISTTINDEEINTLKDTFNTIKDNDQVESEFINELYKQAFNIDLGITNIKNNNILKYDNSIKEGGYNTLSVKTTNIIDENIKKYILQNFYGLRISEKNNQNKNLVMASLQWNIYADYELLDRARTLDENLLNTGDIILVYTGNTATNDTELVDKAYIYLNDKLVRKVSNTEFEELSGNELNQFLLNTTGENYVLLRPSITFERDISNNDNNIDEDIIPDNENDAEEDPDYIENPNTGYKCILIILLLLIVPMLYKRNKQKIYKI